MKCGGKNMLGRDSTEKCKVQGKVYFEVRDFMINI